jgi:RimJ/RimL family protein N-acetyltransferase
MNTRITNRCTPAGTDCAGSACWLREPDDDDVTTLEAWLAHPAINQWFDFGQGRQQLSALALQIMLHSGRHHLRVFGCTGHHAASGLVAVSDVTHAFATGSFWVLRDAQRPTYPGMTCDASRRILHEAFGHYRLRCITAWAVECNVRSQRLLARIGFRHIGVQRDCHVTEGRSFGRVLYDLLPEELTARRRTP